MLPFVKKDSDQLSLASVISLRSIPDDIILESDRSTGKGNRQKQAKKGLPYGSPSKTKKSVKKTGREVWVNAIQNGTGMSMESSAMNSLKLAKGGSQSSTSLFLKEVLGMKTVKQARPLSATSRVAGTGPVYKDAETYYDEIQMLKNTMKQLKNENDIIKAKNVRLEEENIAKSKKIDELLNPDTQSNDLRRTLTSKNPSSSEVVMSLRRKIHRLEESLRSKESETRKIVTDMKYTNYEELRIENEVYLSEINRLNAVLHDNQNQRSLLSDQMVNDALKYSNGTKAEIVIKRLTEENQNLMFQNKSLKSDLMKQSSGNSLQVDLNKDCEDMSRHELLQKISLLEQKVKQVEKTEGIHADNSQSKKTKSANEIEALDERCIELNGPLPLQIKQLRAREKELLEQIDRLEISITKLKEDRSHYRKMTDDYRQQIDANKKTTTNTGTALTRTNTMENEPKAANDIRKKSSIKKPTPTENLKETELVREEKLNLLKEKQAARTIQRTWRNREKNKENTQNSSEESLVDAVVEIQAALKAHLARQKYINTVNDNSKSKSLKNPITKELKESDILLVQSAIRAHTVRSQFLSKMKNVKEKEEIMNKKNVSNHSSVNKLIDEESDEDDAVVVGSSVSLSKYRNNQKSKYDERSNENDGRPNEASRRSNVKPIHDGDHIFLDTRSSHKSEVVDKNSSLNNARMKGTLESFVNSDDLHRKKSQKLVEASSVTQLKASSNPWSNNHKNNVNNHDDNDDDDDDELVCTPTLGRKANELKKESKSKVSKKEADELAIKWANSGSHSKKSKKDSKLPPKPSHQFSKNNTNDDIATASSVQRKLVRSKFAIDDELF